MYKITPGIMLLLNLLVISCSQQQKRTTTAGTPTVSTAMKQDTANTDTSGLRMPQPVGWVSDFGALFSVSEKVYLDSLLSGYEKETSNEIGIVTIPPSWTTAEKFDSLILATHKQWGVGKKEKNNGILIGISPTLRKIRISNGFGIEPILSDDETKKIIDSIIIPEYKQGNYFEGTKKGILAIIAKLS